MQKNFVEGSFQKKPDVPSMHQKQNYSNTVARNRLQKVNEVSLFSPFRTDTKKDSIVLPAVDTQSKKDNLEIAKCLNEEPQRQNLKIFS